MCLISPLEPFTSSLAQCDIITINAPLHEGTKGLINADLLKHFKKGAWLVNTARGAICNTEDVAAAVKSGQLNGYAGDVWNIQPAPKDHPWRYMRNPLGGGNGMTPHYSGTTLDAQARYAAGTKQILENYFKGKPQEPANIIVGVGEYSFFVIEDRSLMYLLISQASTRRSLTASGEGLSLFPNVPCQSTNTVSCILPCHTMLSNIIAFHVILHRRASFRYSTNDHEIDGVRCSHYSMANFIQNHGVSRSNSYLVGLFEQEEIVQKMVFLDWT